jgi:hypothetical protein
MKPGNIKTDLTGGKVGLDRAAPTEEVGKVQHEEKKVLSLDHLPDGKSQLPEAPSSTVRARTSSLVRTQLEQREEQERRTGRRQKLLKVPEAKTLSKAARVAFKTLADLLGRAAMVLKKLRKRLGLEDDEDDREQQRRRQHEDGVPEAEEPKIDPSKVPRPLLI